MKQKDQDPTLAALESYFDAARDAAPTPSTHLLNAILADAAEVTSERAGVTLPPAPPQSETSAWTSLRAIFGGWRTTGFITACLALGFIAGIGGGLDVAANYIWDPIATSEMDIDAVSGFFDLALAEGTS